MNLKENIEKNTKQMLVNTVVELIDKNPEKNIEKIFALVKKHVKDPDFGAMINKVCDYYENNEAINSYIKRIITQTNKKCLKKFFTNFLSNAGWYGAPKRAKYLTKEDTKVPFTILISPSMRCNLRCTGCYAGNYSKEDDIPFEEVDRLVGEARKLGVYFFVILGGEPFFNEYMLNIYKKYDDCMFMPFTNGTLFNEKLADKIVELGNVFPMFSLEGFEEETDKRRGKGTFQKVMNGMDMLKERGVAFGVSSATGRYNMDAVSSDEFFDMLIEKGALISWYFIYMPVGTEPDVNSMLTPEQRIELGKRIRRIRTTKPYFAIDFFNDAPYVGGCIAGKYYCHINSKEDVEPCIFAHFSSINVKDKPLIEAFRTPFFKELRKAQPYNKNLLLPCQMIDNPEVVRKITADTNAKPTDSGADKMIHDQEFMKQLDKLAADFTPYAEKAWKEDFNETGNYKMSKG